MQLEHYEVQSQPQKQHFLFMAKKSKRGQAPTFGTKLNFYHDKRKGHTFRHDEEKRGLPKSEIVSDLHLISSD